MSKNVIKDIPAFCKHRQCVEGTLDILAEELLDIAERDCRINATPVRINYAFQGSVNQLGHLLLSGKWHATADLNCSYCCQKIDYPISQTYDNLQLLDETANSLEVEGDCLECRFDHFELKEWLFSEMMLVLPLAPRHNAACQQWKQNAPHEPEKVSKKLFEILAENQHNR